MDISVRVHKTQDAKNLIEVITKLSYICNSNFCNCCPIGDDIQNCPYQTLLKRKNELLQELEGN